MAELGRPQDYGDDAGVLQLVAIGNRFESGPLSGHQFEIFDTGEARMLWRPRFVSIFGDATAGAGSMTLTLQGLTSGVVGDPWPAGGPLVAAADTDVQAGESYHYTWSTEIADNYSNLDSDFGRIWNGGLPVVYLPQLTTFSIFFTSKGGYGGDFNIDGGHMQIEYFQADTVLGANEQGDQYVWLVHSGSG